ncbi:MAG: DUF1549 domain-containing protein, partial [Planctomycetaceae bacterium]
MLYRREDSRSSARAGTFRRRSLHSSLFALLPIALLVPAVAVGDDAVRGENAESANAILFESKVRPTLQAKCAKCHGEKTRKGELDLSSIAGIRKGGESGSVIVSGKPTESALYERTHSGEMPPDGNDPLTPEELDALRRWIEGGASLGAGAAASETTLTQHDVLPILLLRCTVCHGARKQEAGLDLRSRAAMLKGGKSGPAIKPGKPDESLLLKRIHAEEMPPRQKLIEATVKPMEADEVEKLSRWIALGAPETPDDEFLANHNSKELVSSEERQFWCFQPARSAPLPEVRDSARVRNLIDAFVIERLEEKGLTLSPAADRATLLRRVSFDLTGLPPEPAEIRAFLADEHPEAYERLIERLLASPRYGERWGRHWLDVAGYSDCEGRREQHLPRPWAWRYRDYVIRAFNSDKPYDRFLLEQLAGDDLVDYEQAPEITQEIEDHLVATGFLRMAPDPTWANLTGFVPDRLEVVADAIDVLGSGVMGLTFKCARCHTHKFDPIPQRDFYAIAAIFKGAYDEHDWLKPELQTFGGAVSTGLGERNLPYVTTAERNQWERHLAQVQKEIDALKQQATTPENEQRIRTLEAQRLPEPKIMALWDRGATSPTYLYRRGNYLTAGDPVPPGFPAALTDGDTHFSANPPRSGAKSTGRRLAFARWLTRPDHPLTSRVMVNRIWKHHFGRGIVRTLGNFGKTGERPTHPELLDQLALEFVRGGYSIKAMHRLMMTSSTYMQSSAVTPQMEALDPENRLLSRMPLRRMEAEELRDSLLLVAGELDETRYGPADPVQILPSGLVHTGKRRSIYVQQLRKQPATLLESFDLP